MAREVFVARERELARLDGFLKWALADQGLACFVTGEAGSGKTALVTEFARRAQEQVADLAVAVGQSDAQTGAGDAHLPFREVLGQLTGDVDAKLAAGAITSENAGRLRKLVALSGQALAEVGPDLVGVFVPGAGLAARVGAFVAQKAGWLDKLERLAVRRPEAGAPGAVGIEQGHIFEQYANVLCRLAEKQPLLLVLDDLQWADAASIGLLFRLARRIGHHRVLVVGAYRPEEVAIGRGGERHPLEKVLAELKRYHGDNSVDLDGAEAAEGRRFVDAFLDTEPNALGPAFRSRLLGHTGGHPLFTIELLRTLQERGDLARDAQGCWVETPALAWETLPERVEGVIEERIGRLGRELRRLLTVGSVEGEDFTAEVVAQVQGAQVRGLVQVLGEELERQHRLVSALGVRRLEPGGQRLSQYRFQHNLFRTYLYGELNDSERAYLHEDVGNALESLYGAGADEIAVQLAWHYDEAGIAARAVRYLQRAGEQAAARFANAEAARYFSRALELLPRAGAGGGPEGLLQRYDLHLAREDVYARTGARQEQRQDLAALCALAEELGDDARRAAVSLREARCNEQLGDYRGALEALAAVLEAARRAHDPGLEARALRATAYVLFRKGDFRESLVHAEQALGLAQGAGLRDVEASALHSLAGANWRLGNLAEARDLARRCLKISRATGDRSLLTNALSIAGNIDLAHDDYEAAKASYQEQLQNNLETGDLRGQAMAQGNLGIIAEIEGDFAAAQERFRRVGAIFHDMGDRGSEARALAHMGLNASLQGAYGEGRDFYEQALAMYREIGNRTGEMWVLTLLSRLLDEIGDLEQAAAGGREALRLGQEHGVRLTEAASWVILARVHARRGALAEAAAAYGQGLAIHRELGDENLVMEDLAGLAGVLLDQGKPAEAAAMVDEVVRYAESQPITATDGDAYETYLTCYRVLRAAGDARARGLLAAAHRLLQEQAGRISDPGRRRSYLEDVPAHRGVVQAFAAAGRA